MLFRSCLRAGDGDVTAADLGDAVKLVRYFKSHARKVYAHVEADPRLRLARKIWAWVIREGRWDFKRHEVHNDVRSVSLCPRPEDLDEPLKLLEACRYVRARAATHTGRNGRLPAVVWEVSPLAVEMTTPDS